MLEFNSANQAENEIKQSTPKKQTFRNPNAPLPQNMIRKTPVPDSQGNIFMNPNAPKFHKKVSTPKPDSQGNIFINPNAAYHEKQKLKLYGIR